MSNTEGRWVMTVDEAAAALGISRGLAYQLVRQGDIPSLRLGRRIVIPRHALEAKLNAIGFPVVPAS